MVIFKIKVNDCNLTYPLNIYKFVGNHLKYPILLILPEKIEKNIAIQTTCTMLKKFSQHVGREH